MTRDSPSDRPGGRALIGGIVAGLAGIPPGYLWPGFDPASMPLAVAVVAEPATWLVNHHTAGGYQPAVRMNDNRAPVLRRDGTDKRVAGNSTAMIDGPFVARKQDAKTMEIVIGGSV